MAGSDLNEQLRRAPTYQAALRGQWRAPGLPDNGTRAMLAQHLRAAAQQDGIVIPAGYAFDGQQFNDANADHWYSDPRIIGPAAVGALTFGAGAFGGAAGGGAGAAGGALPSASIPGMHAAVPGSIAGQGGVGLGGMTAAGAGGGGIKGAVSGLGNQMLDNLTTPKGIASLASLVPALMSRGGGGGGGDLMGQNPQLQNLMNMSAERAQRTDPLHQAVTSLAMSRMPVSSRPKG
jgi:hypothetical protein